MPGPTFYTCTDTQSAGDMRASLAPYPVNWLRFSRGTSLSASAERLGVNQAAVVSLPVVNDRARSDAQVRGLLVDFTVEKVLWGSLLVLAALTRFWDLGAKALHHDESLHSYYSWIWASGNGYYAHDPLMHGPLLFFLNAFVYLVFGASDATSRYAPAFAGVLIVGMPWFLRQRQFLGRWGALATSFLLLISPTILYQSRYIRHDVYTVAGVLMMFISIARYVDRPERKWLVTLGVTTALMLANHEIIVANIFIFTSFLYGAIIIERLRAWYGESRDLVYAILALHAFAFVALAGLVLFMPSRYKDRFLNIPWDNHPSRSQQIAYYKDLATNWLIVGLIAVVIAFVVGMVYLTMSYKRFSENGSGWLESAPDKSISAGLRNAVADVRGLALAAGLFVFVFVALFTTLFTNWHGLVTSTFATDGTYFYWLGQHDVRRGEQPWFYFLLLLPQYEFLPITIGAGLAVLTAFRVLRSSSRERARAKTPRSG